MMVTVFIVRGMSVEEMKGCLRAKSRLRRLRFDTPACGQVSNPKPSLANDLCQRKRGRGILPLFLWRR